MDSHTECVQPLGVIRSVDNLGLSKENCTYPHKSKEEKTPQARQGVFAEIRNRLSRKVDITKILTLPLPKAAKKLNLSPGKFRTRWKETFKRRNWPYKAVCRIDKEIIRLRK
jgi:hypothetical protein